MGVDKNYLSVHLKNHSERLSQCKEETTVGDQGDCTSCFSEEVLIWPDALGMSVFFLCSELGKNKSTPTWKSS